MDPRGTHTVALCAALSLVALSGCTYDWKKFDPREAAGGSSSTTTPGGAGGNSTSTTTDSGGSGGAGGVGPFCGDGSIDPGEEECDDGNDTPDDGCYQCVVECDGTKEPTTLHCYKVVTTGATWNNARTDCVNWGGDLLGLSDQDEHDFVNQLFTVPGPYWTGGNDISTEGVYEWCNGEAWTYEAWEPGEPTDDSNPNADEDCIDLYDNPAEGPLFGDNPCGGVSSYVCERYPPR